MPAPDENMQSVRTFAEEVLAERTSNTRTTGSLTRIGSSGAITIGSRSGGPGALHRTSRCGDHRGCKRLCIRPGVRGSRLR
jgi:hypothetical protein